MLLPKLHLMSRVARDIDRCLDFVERQPWGKRDAREVDIYRGIAEVYAHPKRNRPEVYRPDNRVWLRRFRAAQFVIVYAFLQFEDPSLPDVVSIRAVRHVRAANVFHGVRESPTKPSRGEVT